MLLDIKHDTYVNRDSSKSDIEKDHSYSKSITPKGNCGFLIEQQYADDASWVINIETVKESVKSNAPSELKRKNLLVNSSVQFSSILEAGPGCGPLFPDLGILVLGRVPSGSVMVSSNLGLGWHGDALKVRIGLGWGSILWVHPPSGWTSPISIVIFFRNVSISYLWMTVGLASLRCTPPVSIQYNATYIHI